MPISFNTIPIDIRTPGQFIEIDNSRAVTSSPAKPHKALLLGQKTSAGSVAELTPTLIPSSDLAETYWGARSHIAAMARKFKKANAYTELWGIAIDDSGTGTAGTKTLTMTGPSTSDGVIYLYIAGHRIPVAIPSGTSADDTATAINAAILAYSDYARLPYTTGVATNVVTLTAANDGTLSNNIDVRLNYQQGEALPAGIGVAIAAGVTGANDPDFTEFLTAMGDVQYDTIVMASNVDADVEEMAAELEDRWGPMQQKEGHAFCGGIGTQSTLTTAGNGLNSPFVTYFESGGSAATDGNALEPFWEFAAFAAGLDAHQCQVDPARPRQTLPMSGMHPPPPAARFTQPERNTLLTDGISTHIVDDAGTMRIERLITTYQTNPLSIPDPSYLSIETMRLLAQIRWECRVRIALKYPRHKLADDGTLYDPGQAVVTPKGIKAELITLFREWEGKGWVENFDQFKDDLIVERDTSNKNRVNMRMSPDLINQFVVFAGQIQFLL